jgi:predicted secreted Zn-dependent protease
MVLARVGKTLTGLLALAVLFSFSAKPTVEAQVRRPLEDYSEIEKIPGSTRLEYYYLQSPTLALLKEELRKKGPTDLNGKSRDAFTYWRISWQWPQEIADWRDLRCKIQTRVTLPRWNPVKMPPDHELRKWRDFTAALAHHEANHLRNVLTRYDEPCAAIRELVSELGAPPSKQLAQARADDKLQELRRFDLEYDRSTDHGRTEGVRLSP